MAPKDAIESASALRRIRTLEPAGGAGDYVSPPTYPHPEKKKWGVHSYETRRIGGENVECVLLDSVQSQAARMEEALAAMVEGPRADGLGLNVPHVAVDFAGVEGLEDVGRVTSMDLPHRIYDATIRDSMLDDVPFPKTAIGEEVASATPRNATAILRYSATSLVYGAWKSYWGGNLTARFQRCITSEIIGVNVQKGNSPAAKTDPYNISKDVKIAMKDGEMSLDSSGKKPSEYGHGSIISTDIPSLGVTMDYARQTTVITLAGLRKLGFTGKNEQTARVALTALAILGADNPNTFSSLRSRCDLVQRPGGAEDGWEVVKADGSTETFNLDPNEAAAWLKESSEALKGEQAWKVEPTVLVPGKSLVALIKKSRERMLGEEAGKRGRGKVKTG